MLITILSNVIPQETKPTLLGENKLQSGYSTINNTLSIIGIIFGVMVAIAAVILNYRRNHSILYALLAFLFPETYISWFVYTSRK